MRILFNDLASFKGANQADGCTRRIMPRRFGLQPETAVMVAHPAGYALEGR